MKKIIIGRILLFGMVFYFKQKYSVKKDLLIHTTYRMEVDNDGIYNIENILLDSGIEQKNIEVVKRSIIGIARDIPEKSREFELSDKNKPTHLSGFLFSVF